MNRPLRYLTSLACAAPAAPAARADAVTDWNQRAADLVVAAGLANQPAQADRRADRMIHSMALRTAP